jgi:hypothetical protein
MVHKQMIGFFLGFIAGATTVIALIWFAIGSSR